MVLENSVFEQSLPHAYLLSIYALSSKRYVRKYNYVKFKKHQVIVHFWKVVT
jgi:hypothetical protein